MYLVCSICAVEFQDRFCICSPGLSHLSKSLSPSSVSHILGWEVGTTYQAESLILETNNFHKKMISTLYSHKNKRMDHLHPWSPSVCTELWRLLKHQGPLAGCFSFLGIGGKTMKNLWTDQRFAPDPEVRLPGQPQTAPKKIPYTACHLQSHTHCPSVPTAGLVVRAVVGSLQLQQNFKQLSEGSCLLLSKGIHLTTHPQDVPEIMGANPTRFPTHIYHDQIVLTH